MPSVGHVLGRLGLKTSFFHLVRWGGWKRVVFWRAFPPPQGVGLEVAPSHRRALDWKIWSFGVVDLVFSLWFLMVCGWIKVESGEGIGLGVIRISNSR